MINKTSSCDSTSHEVSKLRSIPEKLSPHVQTKSSEGVQSRTKCRQADGISLIGPRLTKKRDSVEEQVARDGRIAGWTREGWSSAREHRLRGFADTEPGHSDRTCKRERS
ncbi:hypothetical protein K0M31_016970 [Melipona bicolor]|uniref:Uncharacterized protein n=1 Tax=Melipona bicolor TaxID=60889 RepID=A0AA40KEA2_9HYME|nr:hypothetical protein K0M31_016970 [Melipona bicolor]